MPGSAPAACDWSPGRGAGRAARATNRTQVQFSNAMNFQQSLRVASVSSPIFAAGGDTTPLGRESPLRRQLRQYKTSEGTNIGPSFRVLGRRSSASFVTWEKYAPPQEKEIKKRGVIQRLSSLNEEKGWVTQVALMSETMLYFTSTAPIGTIGRMLDCIPLHDLVQAKVLPNEPGWRTQAFPGTRYLDDVCMINPCSCIPSSAGFLGSLLQLSSSLLLLVLFHRPNMTSVDNRTPRQVAPHKACIPFCHLHRC